MRTGCVRARREAPLPPTSPPPRGLSPCLGAPSRRRVLGRLPSWLAVRGHCPLLACACTFGRWQRSRVQAKSEYTHTRAAAVNRPPVHARTRPRVVLRVSAVAQPPTTPLLPSIQRDVQASYAWLETRYYNNANCAPCACRDAHPDPSGAPRSPSAPNPASRAPQLFFIVPVRSVTWQHNPPTVCAARRARPPQIASDDWLHAAVTLGFACAIISFHLHLACRTTNE